jgi:hypothetical protein
MTGPDDLEQLLAEVRKTISDNSQFLKKLGEENADDGEDEESVEDEFEEL